MTKNDIDFLVVGSGIAGLSFALRVAERGRVAVVTKKNDSESNTNYAQGGIASVISSSDSFQKHINDTIRVGAGLCNEEIVRRIIEQGPKAIDNLLALGVDFSFTGDTRDLTTLDVGKEGGHSEKRVVHAADYTGREVETRLLNAIKANENIELYEDHLASDLIVDEVGGQLTCYGCRILDAITGKTKVFTAPVTLLATGGAGRVYIHTTNPAIATGDGVAMAYRAGATIANMEFIQFHPTSLHHPRGDSFLISEAVRGEGAHLRDHSGQTFMENYHPDRDLAPRDIVARAIDWEIKISGKQNVFLDMTEIKSDYIIRRFPNIYNRLMALKIDITRDWIPVVPAAHYMCGGVKTDVEGRTDIKNLFAVGETACTGMHGANRLASNSLLEAVVIAEFASYAAKKARDGVETFNPSRELLNFNVKSRNHVGRSERIYLSHALTELQRTMWDFVGVVRSNNRLQLAAKRIKMLVEESEEFHLKFPPTFEGIEQRNLSTVAYLILASAEKRRESRGLHFNADYPDTENDFRIDTLIKRAAEDG